MIHTTELPKVSGVISAYSKPFESLLKEDGETVKNLVHLIQESRAQEDLNNDKNFATVRRLVLKQNIMGRQRPDKTPRASKGQGS